MSTYSSNLAVRRSSRLNRPFNQMDFSGGGDQEDMTYTPSQSKTPSSPGSLASDSTQERDVFSYPEGISSVMEAGPSTPLKKGLLLNHAIHRIGASPVTGRISQPPGDTPARSTVVGSPNTTGRKDLLLRSPFQNNAMDLSSPIDPTPRVLAVDVLCATSTHHVLRQTDVEEIDRMLADNERDLLATRKKERELLQEGILLRKRKEEYLEHMSQLQRQSTELEEGTSGMAIPEGPEVSGPVQIDVAPTSLLQPAIALSTTPSPLSRTQHASVMAEPSTSARASLSRSVTPPLFKTTFAARSAHTYQGLKQSHVTEEDLASDVFMLDGAGVEIELASPHPSACSGRARAGSWGEDVPKKLALPPKHQVEQPEPQTPPSRESTPLRRRGAVADLSPIRSPKRRIDTIEDVRRMIEGSPGKKPRRS